MARAAADLPPGRRPAHRPDAPSPSRSYANGRQSGLVVDMGSTELRCTPVQEGFVMTKGAALTSGAGALPAVAPTRPLAPAQA